MEPLGALGDELRGVLSMEGIRDVVGAYVPVHVVLAEDHSLVVRKARLLVTSIQRSEDFERRRASVPAYIQPIWAGTDVRR